MKRYMSALMLVVAAVLGASAQQTKMLTAEKANEYGIIYSLPVTQLTVEADCQVTTWVPGPYMQYAKRYLGGGEVVTQRRSSVALGDVSLQTGGVASDKKYLMQLKAGALTEVCVSSDGMILAINTQAQEPEPFEPGDGISGEKEPDIDEYLQYVDADYLSSLSSAKRAEMLAQTIMEIRESRLALSRGTAETMPTDGRQLELMLQSLETQEKALTRAFTGYSYTVTQTRHWTLTPDSLMLQDRQTLFRLSDTEGFVDADDYSGEPVYLTLQLVQTPEMPLDAKGEPKAFPKDGVAYALPGTASVAVTYKDRQVTSGQFDFAQYGLVYGLDPKLFSDKKAPSMATFDPATGALLRLETVR